MCTSTAAEAMYLSRFWWSTRVCPVCPATLMRKPTLPFAALPPTVVQKLELIERGYTMANERAIHNHFLGRPAPAEPVAETASEAAMEGFLF